MFFKKKKEETVFKQDLQEKNEHSGLVFAMQLFARCSKNTGGYGKAPW